MHGPFTASRLFEFISDQWANQYHGLSVKLYSQNTVAFIKYRDLHVFCICFTVWLNTREIS